MVEAVACRLKWVSFPLLGWLNFSRSSSEGTAGGRPDEINHWLLEGKVTENSVMCEGKKSRLPWHAEPGQFFSFCVLLRDLDIPRKREPEKPGGMLQKSFDYTQHSGPSQGIWKGLQAGLKMMGRTACVPLIRTAQTVLLAVSKTCMLSFFRN